MECEKWWSFAWLKGLIGQFTDPIFDLCTPALQDV